MASAFLSALYSFQSGSQTHQPTQDCTLDRIFDTYTQAFEEAKVPRKCPVRKGVKPAASLPLHVLAIFAARSGERSSCQKYFFLATMVDDLTDTDTDKVIVHAAQYIKAGTHHVGHEATSPPSRETKLKELKTALASCTPGCALPDLVARVRWEYVADALEQAIQRTNAAPHYEAVGRDIVQRLFPRKRRCGFFEDDCVSSYIRSCVSSASPAPPASCPAPIPIPRKDGIPHSSPSSSSSSGSESESEGSEESTSESENEDGENEAQKISVSLPDGVITAILKRASRQLK